MESNWQRLRGNVLKDMVSGQFSVPPGLWSPSCVLSPASGGDGKRKRESRLVSLDDGGWVRTEVRVTTWVRLAARLGHAFTALELYTFYCACELISMKKVQRGGAGAREARARRLQANE